MKQIFSRFTKNSTTDSVQPNGRNDLKNLPNTNLVIQRRVLQRYYLLPSISRDFRKPLCKVGVVIIVVPARTSLVVNLTASSTPFLATHVYSSKSDSRMCDIRSSVLELITATRELSLTGNLPLYQIISGVGFPAA